MVMWGEVITAGDITRHTPVISGRGHRDTMWRTHAESWHQEEAGAHI